MKGEYKEREKRTYRCNNCEYVFSISQKVGALPYGRCILCFRENVTEIGDDS
jgi:peptide subunit release factor 1 (eRF1)